VVRPVVYMVRSMGALILAMSASTEHLGPTITRSNEKMFPV